MSGVLVLDIGSLVDKNRKRKQKMCRIHLADTNVYVITVNGKIVQVLSSSLKSAQKCAEDHGGEIEKHWVKGYWPPISLDIGDKSRQK